MRPGAILFAIMLLTAPGIALAGPRVFSLDQCADQYVLALSDRAAIVGLSKRADDADAYLRAEAPGLPQRRATLEAVLAARPQVVVRYWGGSPTLLRALERRGIKVVTIGEASDFAGVRTSVRDVAAALDAEPEGEALIGRMDAKLAAAKDAWRDAPALYMSSGGATTGPGTMMDAMLRAAGLSNVTRAPGYTMLRLEQVARMRPTALVLGFFDAMTNALQHWGMGRHRILQGLMRDRAIAALPASVLTCPAWFAADGAETLARAAP